MVPADPLFQQYLHRHRLAINTAVIWHKEQTIYHIPISKYWDLWCVPKNHKDEFHDFIRTSWDLLEYCVQM